MRILGFTLVAAFILFVLVMLASDAWN